MESCVLCCLSFSTNLLLVLYLWDGFAPCTPIGVVLIWFGFVGGGTGPSLFKEGKINIDERLCAYWFTVMDLSLPPRYQAKPAK